MIASNIHNLTISEAAQEKLHNEVALYESIAGVLETTRRRLTASKQRLAQIADETLLADAKTMSKLQQERQRLASELLVLPDEIGALTGRLALADLALLAAQRREALEEAADCAEQLRTFDAQAEEIEADKRRNRDEQTASDRQYAITPESRMSIPQRAEILAQKPRLEHERADRMEGLAALGQQGRKVQQEAAPLYQRQKKAEMLAQAATIRADNLYKAGNEQQPILDRPATWEAAARRAASAARDAAHAEVHGSYKGMARAG